MNISRVLILALAAAFLASFTGCDRTRPWGGAPDAPATSAAPADPTTPAPAAPSAGDAAGATVVTADGVQFVYVSPGASSVHLAGSFNGWSTSADPLAKNAAGVWTLVKALDPGTHQYKFVVNGGEWKEDPTNPNTVDDGHGGNNSEITVP